MVNELKHRYISFFKNIIILLFVTLWVGNLSAQEQMAIRGEYSYMMSDNESKEDAKKAAIERAYLTALSENFGTMISQNNYTRIESGSDTSDMRFFSLRESEIRGEWLRDIEPPRTETIYDAATDKMVIIAYVYGYARERVTAYTDLEIKLLCNGVTERHESDIFHSGDQLFLSFRSPVKGYVAVYLVDESDCAFCMLPYETVESGNIEVKAKEEYVFFSKEHVKKPLQSADVKKLQLYTNQKEEINTLYVIFSAKPFVKANDRTTESDNGLELLPSLSFKHFQKWLSKNQMRDKSMQVNTIPVKILSR